MDTMQIDTIFLILSEKGKYKLNLTIIFYINNFAVCNQYCSFMPGKQLQGKRLACWVKKNSF